MTGRLRWQLVAWVAAVVAVLGLVYISWPVGHIPLYDANLVRLAETDLQGYCAGETFWRSQGTGNSGMAADCRRRLARRRPNSVNLLVVQAAFCTAIVRAGWGGTRQGCLQIMDDNQYWPTYAGAITNQWNHARPYPRPLLSTRPGSPAGSGSRTGGRNGGSRQNTPTHRVPRYP